MQLLMVQQLPALQAQILSTMPPEMQLLMAMLHAGQPGGAATVPVQMTGRHHHNHHRQEKPLLLHHPIL